VQARQSAAPRVAGVGSGCVLQHKRHDTRKVCMPEQEQKESEACAALLLGEKKRQQSRVGVRCAHPPET